MSPLNPYLPHLPYLGSLTPNLRASNGFEGMAVSPSGRNLYPLLEGTVTGDDSINSTVFKNLRISKFDTKTRSYTGDTWIYQLEPQGTNIGDMTAINDTEGFGLLSIYIDRRWAISGRRHALRSADQLRRSLLRGLEVDTPMAWFQELVLALADTAAKVVNGLNDEVDDAEDKILVGRVHAQATVLGRIRRILARLRRQVVANRAALATISANFPAWCDPEYRESSRQAVGRLEAVAQDLELVQERTRLLQEEIASRLGEATSRNLFLLSVLTATFLPVTLISGIFGMNVGGLPWLKSPSGFWWACGLMVAAAVTTLLLLRKWRN